MKVTELQVAVWIVLFMYFQPEVHQSDCMWQNYKTKPQPHIRELSQYS